ncbi:hypothetical protein HPB50_021659 [Hyalomma asiaticum]|uniref:Uncharacterized protein n=1 Tax=Hyalomma asiaticum TaxID=266040 RepID=A0ACB7T7A8_HYAAI|nr:hypothetical protein HPB50_021659 [Hyalomma asiaticum]
MGVQVLTEDNFTGHQGNDLYDPEKATYRNFKVKKLATLRELLELVAEQMGYPLQGIRPWAITYRSNQTFRPAAIDLDADMNKTVIDLSENLNPWTLFMETIAPDQNIDRLPDFDKETDVLLFFKMYDPRLKQIAYCGHVYMPIVAKAKELLPLLNKRAGFPADTELVLYEEVKPNIVDRIEDLELPLEKVLEELMDGDIIVFQRLDLNVEEYELPTVKDYFRDLFYRVEVAFCDKMIPNDPGFTMELSLKMNYDQLSIRINELESKKQFKCIWVNSKFKEEKELVLYPNKNGCVSDLLEEARKQVELSEDGSGKLRLMEIISYKIFAIQRDDVSLDTLSQANSKSYRIEEIPREDLIVADNEILIPCAHFQKEIFSTFGVPFMLKIKHGEPFTKVKDRIQKKLDVPDKEFEKYKFAIVVMGRAQFIEDNEYVVNLSDFMGQGPPATQMHPRPWLGIEHVNKAPKRSRYNYLEKAIKIHN